MDTPLSIDQASAPAGPTIRLTNGKVSRYDHAFRWIDVLPNFSGIEECLSFVSLFACGDRALRQFPVQPIYFPVRAE
jgi:hypothetical protein